MNLFSIFFEEIFLFLYQSYRGSSRRLSFIMFDVSPTDSHGTQLTARIAEATQHLLQWNHFRTALCGIGGADLCGAAGLAPGQRCAGISAAAAKELERHQQGTGTATARPARLCAAPAPTRRCAAQCCVEPGPGRQKVRRCVGDTGAGWGGWGPLGALRR